MSEATVSTPSRVLYTAEATVTGGRRGHGRTSDDRLTVDFSSPAELGGDGGPGTNPEQLFALGYAACFQNAMLGIARRKELVADDSTVTARMGWAPSAMAVLGSQSSCTSARRRSPTMPQRRSW